MQKQLENLLLILKGFILGIANISYDYGYI